jgi:uncharacterized CHY-type Zn-finger protein
MERVVLCPFCDHEQRAREERVVIRCERCSRAFNADIDDTEHPSEFWANPDSSVRF